MKLITAPVFICVLAVLSSLSYSADNDIIIENAEMKLVLSGDGRARSLIHKASGRECLLGGTDEPAFIITQYRPYENELQLTYPAKERDFIPDSVRREGDRLILSFGQVNYEAVIRLDITDAYIGFSIEQVEHKNISFRNNPRAPIDEMIFLQIPAADRKYFGEWLNVVWDEEIAVNVLSTDPYARIDADNRQGYRLLQAGAASEVKMHGVGAALIVTESVNLLDRIAQVEEDFDLPRGVESRRSEEYRNSYYEVKNITPQNADRHIEYARQGGFRAMVIYYPDFALTAGHFPWRPEYPNGMADLKSVIDKIKKAGMVPGFHIHYNKAHKNDPYVSPEPDHRLNLSRRFTLAKDLKKMSSTIAVHENPKGCTLDDNRRLLKTGNELISYEGYTTDPPYMFNGCKRGELGTKAEERKAGDMLGLLDVDTWPIFVRFNQNTDIQEEMARRLGAIYHDAGFEFVYFDGAEDVHPPYWYNVSNSQLTVYQQLYPKPLFSEGACKSHFSWHMLTRGNAFDIFSPEDIRESTRKHQAAEAALLAQDFTALNFGWVGYFLPAEKTDGTQPDMIEYITSRAAAWDCPISLVGFLDRLDSHPRTPDNLEVVRRWEEVRAQGILSEKQKTALRNLGQEHILLLNEEQDYELLPYEQIQDAAGKDSKVSAFIFERNGRTVVVYWHISAEAFLKLETNPARLRFFEEIGKELPFKSDAEEVTLPVGKRRYIEFDTTKAHAVDVMRNARVVSGP